MLFRENVDAELTPTDVVVLFQTEVCSGALTDVIHAVINGTDGCLFCFGHARLGEYSFVLQWKSY
jgi:hypothetical protein